MSGVPPVVFHQPRHAHPDKHDAGGQDGGQREEHPHKARLPIVPDLRFEYSYLRSVRTFVEVERVGGASSEAPAGAGGQKQTQKSSRTSAGPSSTTKVGDELLGDSKGRTEAAALDKALLEEGYETLDASLGYKGRETEGGIVDGTVELRTNDEHSEARGPKEVIRVQWKKVLWVTMRDQVLSPLVQGALWAMASYYITPISAQVGSKVGTFVRDHGRKEKEGEGVSWLRSWAQKLGFGGHELKQIRR